MQRGEVYRLRSVKAVGHEQAGERYGVIVQANELLPRSVVLVAPTSTSARASWYRPVIELPDGSTRVMVEHMKSVDVSRLGYKMADLSLQEIWAVDEALLDVIGLR